LAQCEFICIPIDLMEIPAISMCMTDEALEGVELRGTQCRNRAGSGDNLSEGTPCGGHHDPVPFCVLHRSKDQKEQVRVCAMTLRVRDSYRASALGRQVLCQLFALPFELLCPRDGRVSPVAGIARSA
jgi:hypothetical protein